MRKPWVSSAIVVVYMSVPGADTELMTQEESQALKKSSAEKEQRLNICGRLWVAGKGGALNEGQARLWAPAEPPPG